MQETNFRCYRCMNKLEQNLKFCPVCGNEIVNQKLLSYALPPGTILNEKYLVGHVINKDKKTLTYIGLDTHLESRVLIIEIYIKEILNRFDTRAVIENGENEKIFEDIKTNFYMVHKNLTKLRVLPNISKIYSIFSQNNTIYVVKEISRGITFNEYLSNNYGELSWNQSKKLFLDLIKLLKHIHSLKIIHQDLTPNNLYFENNMLKIIDFKNAKIEDKFNLNFILNEGYSAPEQYDNKGIGTYSDVYSLAAIMYKSLTGTKPVNSRSRLSNDNLLPPNILNPNIPKNVSFAITSALVLAPKLRTQTMKDFYEDLIAPPRETSKIHMLVKKENPKTKKIKQKNLKKESTEKIKKQKRVKENEEFKELQEGKKETKTKKIIFLSFLISCSIVSFFLVIAIFLLFGDNFFE